MLSEDQRRFVEDVLSLYRALQLSFKELENKSGISAQELFPKQQKGPQTVLPVFSGFYGKAEIEKEYWLYCVEIIKQQGRFGELDYDENEDLISLGPRVGEYQRMLASWEEMGRPETLSWEQMRNIWWAEILPGNRPTLANKVRDFFHHRWGLIAKIAGCSTGITILIVCAWAFRELDITTYIEYDEPRLVSRGDVEYEVSGFSSPLGLASGLIAFFVGCAVYEVIYNGPLAIKDRLDFQAIIAGSVFYGVVGQIWFELFYGSKWGDFLVYILEIATATLTYFLFKKWRDQRLKNISG